MVEENLGTEFWDICKKSMSGAHPANAPLKPVMNVTPNHPCRAHKSVHERDICCAQAQFS